MLDPKPVTTKDIAKEETPSQTFAHCPVPFPCLSYTPLTVRYDTHILRDAELLLKDDSKTKYHRSNR